MLSKRPKQIVVMKAAPRSARTPGRARGSLEGFRVDPPVAALFGVALRLAQLAPCVEQREERKAGRDHAGTRLAHVLEAEATDRGTDREAESEGDPDEGHALAALLGGRDVGDVRLGRGDGAAEASGQDPRDEEPGQGCAQERSDGEQRIRERGSHEAQQDHGPSAVPIRETSPNGCREELHRRERAEEQPEHPLRRAVRVAVQGSSGRTMPNPRRSMTTVRKTEPREDRRCFTWVPGQGRTSAGFYWPRGAILRQDPDMRI